MRALSLRNIENVHSPILLSDHAIYRYRARCRPELSLGRARHALKAELPHAKMSSRRPSWVLETPSSLNAVSYLVAEDRFCLPLRQHRQKHILIAPTCLVPEMSLVGKNLIEATELFALERILKLAPVLYSWHKQGGQGHKLDLLRLILNGNITNQKPLLGEPMKGQARYIQTDQLIISLACRAQAFRAKEILLIENNDFTPSPKSLLSQLTKESSNLGIR